MRRAVSVFLAALLACASANAQNPNTPKPQPGGFISPTVNWVKPKTPSHPTPPTPSAPAGPSAATESENGPDSAAVRTPQNSNPAGPFQIPYIAEVARVAMALPVDAPGLVGRAADSFHQGCLKGVQAERARLWIDLYPAADAASEVAAYQAALADDAQFIIGPMSKSGARAILKKFPAAPVPTILLQPVSDGGENYFIMTLDAAREAAALAKFLFDSGEARAVVVANESALGQRQAAAFSGEWRKLSGEYPRKLSARIPADLEREDLREVFREFKKQTEAEADLADAPPPPVVFIAGGSEFARRARSYLPARYPAYAGSLARADEEGPATLQLEGLRFLEIPWLLDPAADSCLKNLPDDDNAFADFGRNAARTLAERRFFALGADVCRAALRSPEWSAHGNGWEFKNGCSGRHLTLRANEFRRILPIPTPKELEDDPTKSELSELAEYREGRAEKVGF